MQHDKAPSIWILMVRITVSMTPGMPYLSRPLARATPQKTENNSLTRPITLAELVRATDAKRRNGYPERI
jgi:hypothetical protein